MWREEWRPRVFRLAGCCAAILAAAAVLALLANTLRPAESRLPWVGDWANYVETRARAAGIEPVTMPVVKEMMAKTPPAILLDARPQELYVQGRLPGARSLPLVDFLDRLQELAPELPPDVELLLYCDGLDCGDSLSLGMELQMAGYTRLFLYPGGYAEWAQYEGTIEKDVQP